MARKSRPSEEEVIRHLPTIVRQVLGDYQKVAKLAQEASSTKKWRARQTAKTVTLMVLAACPPLVIAVPASLLGYVYTIRKMAHVAWGVGARMAAGQDSAVIDPEIDLIAIMALWAGATLDQVKKAVRVVGPYAWKATRKATMAVAALREDSIGGAYILKALGHQHPASDAHSAASNVLSRLPSSIREKINRKLFKEIFTWRLGGVIPVAGPVFNGAVSWTLMHQIGKYAEQYYADKFQITTD